LLAAAEREGPFLRRATMESQVEAKPGEGAGTTIGVYKLLQLIGEGGFGSVFMAEQESPVRRRVALKIIKLGMDTRAVVARFEQERQALALMDHPNIAKVLGAGATESGRPYFVMELVKGDPITAYCDKNNLTIQERLALFTQVCQAVQHAHTKGVIHRDIKPSNILVGTQDGKPMARVIDFGIAKATSHRMTEKTVFTEFRQLIGTPEYMSPEQAEGGLDVDTRTDVYSLGVLLYELLTGSTPFDGATLRSAAYNEMQRIIREVEPPKPSTKIVRSTETLTDVAAHRRIEPSRLGTLVRGELDWIVMKALEKDRGRRYESPSGLAGDVQRYLDGDAVSAAPPSAAYKVRKFARRHRVAVTAGGLVGAALVLGVIGTTIGLVNARTARDRALAAEKLAEDRFVEAEGARERATASEQLATERLAEAVKAKADAERFLKVAGAVTEFFTLDVLDLDPTPPGTPDLTVREALDRVPQKIKDNFASEPAVEGSIRERVGQLYLNLGDMQKASEYLIAAVPLLEKGLGPEKRETMRAQQRLGELLLELDRYVEAEAQFDKVYQARMRSQGPTYNLTFNSLARRGEARVLAGRVAEGLADVESALSESSRIFGDNTKMAVILGRQLGEDYITASRPKDAERVARELLEKIRTHEKDLAPGEPEVRALLGESLLAQERLSEAMPELEAAYSVMSKEMPAYHGKLLNVRIHRGRAMLGLGRVSEARAELEQVYMLRERQYGPAVKRCREVARSLAEAAARAGDEEGAAKWRAKAR